jgi:hypothetical protein
MGLQPSGARREAVSEALRFQLRADEDAHTISPAPVEPGAGEISESS